MKKKTAVIIISLLSAAAIGLGAFAVIESTGRREAESTNDLYGEKALGELATSLSAMTDSMEKSLYCTESVYMTELCAKAASNAASALAAFGMLPYSTHELEKMAGYINTSGDYTLFLARLAASGSLPDEEQSAALAELTGVVKKLSDAAIRILQQLQEGAVDMDNYGDSADDNKPDTVGYELSLVEQGLPELPRLEYDGVLSASNDKPAAMTENAKSVTEDEARRAAARFLGVSYDKLSGQGKTESLLPCWQFGYSPADGDDRLVCVTEKGGFISSLSSSRKPAEGEFTGEEAVKLAESFLVTHEYKDMAQAGIEEKDGLTVITWVYVQDDVYCMPDAVSVAVAQDTGEIAGFEAGEYIMNHKERQNLTPAIDSDQAAEALSDELTPLGARLVLRQNDGGEEKLYWEIACRNGENDEISAFIDAFTGKEGKIEIEQT